MLYGATLAVSPVSEKLNVTGVFFDKMVTLLFSKILPNHTASLTASCCYCRFYKLSTLLTTDDKTEKAVNGEETVESEHQANEGTTEEEEAGINSCYYDKSKSFFDNLSCDERAR